MLPISKNPPTRYPEGIIEKKETPWWVAKVKSRQEKAFAFDLLNREIEYYLPMYTKVTRRKDNNKPRKSIMPLFSGYVSFCTDEFTARSLYTTNRISTIIEVRGQLEFIKELNQIYHAVNLNITIEPVALSKLSLGQKVLIEAGPMKGMSGYIIKKLSKSQIAITVESLNMAAVITVDATVVTGV